MWNSIFTKVLDVPIKNACLIFSNTYTIAKQCYFNQNITWDETYD